MPVGTILLSFYTLLLYLQSGRTLASTTTVVATYATRGGIRIVINNKTGVDECPAGPENLIVSEVDNRR